MLYVLLISHIYKYLYIYACKLTPNCLSLWEMYLFPSPIFVGPIARNWLFAINLYSNKCRRHSTLAFSFPTPLAAQLAIKLFEIVKNVLRGTVRQHSQSKIQPTHLYLYICISAFVSACGRGQPELRSKTHTPSPLSPFFGLAVRVHLDALHWLCWWLICIF